MSSRDARSLWADPYYAGRTDAAIQEAFLKPEVRAKITAACKSPAALAELSNSHKALAQTADRREQLARVTEASLTPSARSKRKLAIRWRHRRSGGCR